MLKESRFGVIAMPLTPDRGLVAVPSNGENHDKWEQTNMTRGEYVPVLGYEFPGGAAEGDLLDGVKREVAEELPSLGSLPSDRFSLLPVRFMVEQLRSGTPVSFSVFLFSLRLLEEEAAKLVSRGGVLVSSHDTSRLRARDTQVLVEARL